MRNYSVLFVAGIVLLSCQRAPQLKKDDLHDQKDDVRQEAQIKSEIKRQDSAKIDSPTPSSPGNLIPQRAELIGQPKKKVLVLNFWNDTPIYQEDIALFATTELKRRLLTTQKVILTTAPRGDLFTEDFVQQDRIKVAQLIREGRKLGAAILVIGRISKIIFRQNGDDVGVFRQKQSLSAAEIETKIFETQNGKEVYAGYQYGEANNDSTVIFNSNKVDHLSFKAALVKAAIQDAINNFIPNIIKYTEKLTWEGRIAKVSGRKIYINSGRASGLMLGDILKVLTQGEDIYDSNTGAYLGRSEGQLKGTIEVTDFIGPDAALGVIHTGGNFREGERVQLY